MKTKAKRRKTPLPVLVAPDRVTVAHVERILGDSDLNPALSITLGRGFTKRVKKHLSTGATALVLIPSPKLFRDQLALVRDAGSLGTSVFVWSSGAVYSDPKSRDAWILERLLEQAGAIATARLPALVESVKILTFLGPTPASGLHIACKPSHLTSLVRSALREFGIVPKSKRKGAWTFKFSGRDKLLLAADEKRNVTISDPHLAAEALALLPWPTTAKASKAPEERVEPRRDEIDLIVRPPARLLSETTSKRLATGFGINLPSERLCDSATEAVRFASSLSGPAVLKLVRPALVEKRAASAVRIGIRGPAAVRRAVHGLDSIAAKLGPPVPLGILVSELIDGGDRIWIKMEDHPKLGRLIIIGPGDSPSKQPTAALSVPATTREAIAAIMDAGLASSSETSAKLGRAVSRFAVMLETLGPRINRAEIHPLVATENSTQGLALDALVGIGAP